MPYSYITFAQAQAALSLRLNDPTFLYWTAAELGLYLTEALRTWNAYTGQWTQDFTATIPANSTWVDFTALTNSPRARTVTDAQVYTLMQYHLLEPPTGGGTWTGTAQFSLARLSNALAARRDEALQVSGAFLALQTIAASTGTRYALPDSVLAPLRVRSIPTAGANQTLWREDQLSERYYDPGTPLSAWAAVSNPPLSVDLDAVPPAGNIQVLTFVAGSAFAPPTATPLGVPDDLSFVPKWGALYDLLAAASEATDEARAAFCWARYQDGLKLMRAANWLLLGSISGQAVDTPGVAEMDAFSPNWEETGLPALVVAGTDCFALSPLPKANTSVTMTVVGNAPIPVNGTDPVQVSRDTLDVILDYAQALAFFKCGGEEAAQAKPLMANFAQAALAANDRIRNLGIFTDVLKSEGERQDVFEPRYSRE